MQRISTLFKVDRALSKLSTLLTSNKKEFNHFFKSRSSDIVLLKLDTESEARISYISEREAQRSLGRTLILASEASCPR